MEDRRRQHSDCKQNESVTEFPNKQSIIAVTIFVYLMIMRDYLTNVLKRIITKDTN